MTDEMIVRWYRHRRPKTATNKAIVADLATRSGKTVNEVRGVLVAAKVYVTGADSKSLLDRENDASRALMVEREKVQHARILHEQAEGKAKEQAERYERVHKKSFSQMARQYDTDKTPMMPIEIMAIIVLVAIVFAAIGMIFK